MLAMSPIYAQNVMEKYTQEDIRKYAELMAWSDLEKENLTNTYNKWIKENEELNAPRFLAIRRTNSDSVELSNIEATEAELHAFNEIQKGYDSLIALFKELFIEKIEVDMGAKLYNSLSSDLKSDEELKSKYQRIRKSINSSEAVKNKVVH